MEVIFVLSLGLIFQLYEIFQRIIREKINYYRYWFLILSARELYFTPFADYIVLNRIFMNK